MMVRATNLLWMTAAQIAICAIPLATDDGAGSGVRIFVAVAARRAFLFSLIALTLALSLTGASSRKTHVVDTEDVTRSERGYG